MESSEELLVSSVLALILSGKKQMKGQQEGSAVEELARSPEGLSWILRTHQIQGGNPLRKVVLNNMQYANSYVYMHTHIRTRAHTHSIHRNTEVYTEGNK